MPLRAVVDTNTVISAALLSRSVPRQALDILLENCIILTSAETWQELVEVIYRPKFDKYLIDTDRITFLAGFLKTIELVEILETIQACRDPRDNKFLEVAVAGKAGMIITGDRDLLELDPFRDVRIITPKSFLENFSNEL